MPLLTRLLFSCLALLLLRPAFAAERPLAELADEQFAFAARQYVGMLDALAGDTARQPRTVENGKLKTTNVRDWTSGFFPGNLWLVYEHTRDPRLLAAARDFTARQESIQHFTDHHDVGFMLFCSYGQGLRLAPAPGYREVLVNGARSLATRFDPKVGLIKSWNSNAEWPYPVIIDNMMNLELLIWAARESGDTRLHDIAVSHANRTLHEHFRPDGSSFHLVAYNNDGTVKKKQTVQGFADGSAWARGQAWGLYGYTRMHQLTGEPAYLDQAIKIAEFISNHPRLPADGIPYWDFDATNIPDCLRDASAGAIMASALLDLAPLAGPERGPRYRTLAERQIRSLCTAAYRANLGENGGFLLMHSVGHMSRKTEVDVPLVYADYYFLEALAKIANRPVHAENATR